MMWKVYYIPYDIFFSVVSIVCDLVARDFDRFNISWSDLPALIFHFLQLCIM